jgi:hypothetical protein
MATHLLASAALGTGGMAIHWAAPLLAQLLRTGLMDRINEAQVDPFRPAPDRDHIPLLNGKTGETLLNVPLSKSYRVTRSRMRKLCSEGIDIHVGIFTFIRVIFSKLTGGSTTRSWSAQRTLPKKIL